MVDERNFYGFRGNITAKNITIYNVNYEDSSKSRNDIFNSFFAFLKNKESLSTSYQKRKYVLIYKHRKNNVIHCLIARKREIRLNKLDKTEISEIYEEDFPYVNVFVELDTQKFIIEINSDVFNNPETCKRIVENIMGNYFKNIDFIIEIIPITKEAFFWNIINSDFNYYKLELEFNMPNWGNSESAAKELVEDTKNMGSEKTTLIISNSQGNLKMNNDSIRSFVKYISEGAGTWKVIRKDKKGKKEIILSGEKKVPVSISFLSKNLNRDFEDIEWDAIYNAFGKLDIYEEMNK